MQRFKYMMLFSFLAGAACDAEVSRALTLEGIGGVPTATSALAGTTLTVGLSRFEPLEARYRVGVWARDASGWERLGSIDGVKMSAFDLSGGALDLESADTLLLGRERADREEAAPGSVVYFRGPLTGPLMLGGMEGRVAGDSFEGVAANANAVDRELTLGVESLPHLPESMEYAVWLLEDADPADAWHDGTYLGVLDPGEGGSFRSDELIALHRAIAVTLEPRDGTSEPSPQSTVLYGLIPPEPVEDANEDEGGHLH